MQGLDHGFEGRFLVGEGGQGALASMRQKIGERGVQVEIEAQGEGVDKVTDEGFQLRTGAVGHGRADD